MSRRSWRAAMCCSNPAPRWHRCARRPRPRSGRRSATTRGCRQKTPPTRLKTAEAALREEFGYDALVLAYDIGTVARIVDAYPFEREVPGHHSYVTFVSDPAVLEELAGLAPGPV